MDCSTPGFPALHLTTSLYLSIQSRGRLFRYCSDVIPFRLLWICRPGNPNPVSLPWEKQVAEGKTQAGKAPLYPLIVTGPILKREGQESLHSACPCQKGTP